MKIPSKPPTLDFASSTFWIDALKITLDPEGAEYLARANTEYLYWDKLRRRPQFKEFSAPQTWAAIKFSRMSLRKTIPLIDQAGNQFTYGLPQNLMQLLHEVDRHASGSHFFEEAEYSLVKQAKEQVLVSSLMEEAIATSQIEGAVTTRDQAKAMLRSERKAKNKSEQMIVNSYRTIRMLRTVVNEDLSINLLNRIQKMITEGTLEDDAEAGRFRTAQEPVRVIDQQTAEVIYTPPPADQLNERMQRLVQFANETHVDQKFIHPLVKASILHFSLAYEHPYVDGNGRTARALFYWYMLKKGYWLFEFLTISRAVYRSPTRYYRSFLHTEFDQNDLTYSLSYMFKVTQRAIEQLKSVLLQKRNETRARRKLVTAFDLNDRQRELLNHAIFSPGSVYTIAEHRSAHQISYETARSDLLNLSKRGLLIQRTAGKKLIFIAANDLRQKLGV